MTITQTTTVMFDPVKEWKAAREFESKNKGWEKEESTVCVAYTKMEHWNIPEAERRLSFVRCVEGD